MNFNDGADEAVEYDEYAARWRFRVPVAATTNQERFEEMLSVVETLFEAFDPLLTPTLVEYQLSPYGEGDTNDIDDSLVDSEGISFDRFSEVVSSHGDGSDYRLSPVGFQGPITVRLTDGDYEISPESDQYRGSDDIYSPSEPPISVSITQISFLLPGDEYEYVIEILTHTNVWFEETEYGAVNRERLVDVLSTVEESLDPYAADITSEKYYGKMEYDFPDLFFSYRSEFPDTADDTTES